MDDYIKMLPEKRQKLEWIPIDVALPDNDRYILIAFENLKDWK